MTRHAMTLMALLAACGGADDARPDAGPDAGEERDAIVLPGDEVYPEGITAAADGSLFVGSIRHGTILRAEPGAASAEAFVAAGANGLVSTVGLLAEGDRLWACSSDPGVSDLTGTSPPALAWFDLDSGAPIGRAELPGGGFCNDIAVDTSGTIYLTDSFAPRILVLPAGEQELEVWLEDEAFAGEGFNLNGIEVVGDSVYAVKYNSGQLFEVPIGEDGMAGAPVAVALDRALESPDGLRAFDGDLLVVEGVGRLSRIESDGKVTAIRDGLDQPSTAVIQGGDAWVVEAQLGHLFDPTSGSPTLPFQVVAVPLD